MRFTGKFCMSLSIYPVAHHIIAVHATHPKSFLNFWQTFRLGRYSFLESDEAASKHSWPTSLSKIIYRTYGPIDTLSNCIEVLWWPSRQVAGALKLEADTSFCRVPTAADNSSLFRDVVDIFGSPISAGQG